MPKTLHSERKPSSIKVSLQTRDPSSALRLAQMLSFAAETMLASGALHGMRYDEIRAVLRKHFGEMLTRKRRLIAQDGRLPDQEVAKLKSHAANAQNAVTTDARLLPETDDADVMSAFIRQYRLPVEAGTKAYGMLQKELKRAYRDYCSKVLEFDQGLETFDFDRASAVSNVDRSKRAETGISLGELTQRYMRERIVGKIWTEKTARERARQFALLEQILGASTDTGTFTIADRERLKDTLVKLPKNRNKNPKIVGLQLADALTVKSVAKLNPRTFNKYLQTFADLFRWAEESGLSTNPFQKLTIRHNSDREDAPRSGFSAQQITRMLDVMLGDSPPRGMTDSLKWGSLIGIYTGARINEVAQILLDDIKQDAGVWFFDINPIGLQKRLKTKASKRSVPIHGRLIELGLFRYAERLRANSEQRLFPDFTYDKNNGYGRKLGRWFNDRFLPSIDLKTKQLVFHSLRHTLVTELKNARVEHDIVQAIVGHKSTGTTAGYFGGYKPQVLADSLNKLPF